MPILFSEYLIFNDLNIGQCLQYKSVKYQERKSGSENNIKFGEVSFGKEIYINKYGNIQIQLSYMFWMENFIMNLEYNMGD